MTIKSIEIEPPKQSMFSPAGLVCVLFVVASLFALKLMIGSQAAMYCVVSAASVFCLHFVFPCKLTNVLLHILMYGIGALMAMAIPYLVIVGMIGVFGM